MNIFIPISQKTYSSQFSIIIVFLWFKSLKLKHVLVYLFNIIWNIMLCSTIYSAMIRHKSQSPFLSLFRAQHPIPAHRQTPLPPTIPPRIQPNHPTTVAQEVIPSPLPCQTYHLVWCIMWAPGQQTTDRAPSSLSACCWDLLLFRPSGSERPLEAQGMSPILEHLITSCTFI